MTATVISREAAGLPPLPSGVSTNITPQGNTDHYGGGSPWGGKVRVASNADHNRCASIWKSWRDYHVNGNKWADIAYSYGVCPHGFIYTGRGKGRRTAANGTNQGNQISYAVVYIAGDGDFVTEEARRAFHDAYALLGVPAKWIHKNWLSTGCPGGQVEAWVKAGRPMSMAAPIPTTPPPSSSVSHIHGEPLVKFAARPGTTNIHGAVYHPELNGWVWQTDYNTVYWEVMDIQKHMRDQGHSIAVDGKGGPDTLTQLKAYQGHRGLTTDGVVGPNTWAKLHGR